MAAGDIFQQTAIYQFDTVSLANVYYLEVLDDSGTTDAEADAAAALDSQWLAILATIQSNALEYECILSRRVQPTTAPSRVFPINRPGSRAGLIMPTNVTYQIRHYSEDSQRRKRGRWAVGTPVEADITNGRFDEGLNALFQIIEDAAIAPLVDSGRSYRLNHLSRTNNIFYPIEKAVIQPTPGKLRPRTPGICSIT